MNNRFAITYNEQGVQLHNSYIDRIVKGIVEHDRRCGIKIDRPNELYGLIHRDEKCLLFWERVLVKENLLIAEVG